jgi:phosphoenolpyruvate synthase/pyruvate phosphate dikinase
MKAIGSKARHLRKMLEPGIPNVNLTTSKMAFVIPFYYFHKFVHAAAGPELNALFQTRNETGLKALASAIREKIESAQMDNELRAKSVQINFDELHRPPLFADGLILRSSTNCEDLPGFPSAGLYRSEPVMENN